jgi:hypothetical protein
MTDVTKSEETKPSSPELLAQEEAAKCAAEAQQQMQQLEAEIARGKRMLTLSCLNLCHLAIGSLPRPEQADETPKAKKNPAKRMLTLADLDKVSAIVERFTQAAAHLSSGGMPMGMMGPRGMMR